jgi:murein DD-endopeptidase MepM/ murein hydrolase activator NlpD
MGLPFTASARKCEGIGGASPPCLDLATEQADRPFGDGSPSRTMAQGAERVVERWRHAPVGRPRIARAQPRPLGLPHVYRGRARRPPADIYASEHGEARRGGRFRWLLSTCLAGAVGVLGIGVALLGTIGTWQSDGGVLPALKRFREGGLPEPLPPLRSVDGLGWLTPRSDRLAGSAGALSTKHIIHDQVQVRRDNRPFIQIKPYLRIVARLASVPEAEAEIVPQFNPFRLYAAAATAAEGSDESPAGAERSDVAIRVVELLGGILPGEDGQELDTQEVTDLVAAAQEADADAVDMRPGFASDASDPTARTGPDGVAQPLDEGAGISTNTTVVAKSGPDDDDSDDDLERTEARVVRVARGDSLTKILQRHGAEAWQARAMVEAAKSVFPESALGPGQEVHITLVPSLTKPDRSEPARFSVFAEGHEHKVTVTRNAAGEFIASASPFDTRIARAALGDSDRAQSTSLYASLYHAALMQGIPPETILQILRVHAYETDFRRRLRSGDTVDFFFDLKEEAGADSAPGELLYTAISSGGETQRFWRFRTADGLVDYYDEFGNNSKKFLMRRPVRGEDVRLTSGYGVRVHPIFNVPKMHTGVDWSAPTGTPILAAGSGVIEEADRKGQNGNYVRIRHANGYQTAYSHLSRFGPGIRASMKVRQGQVIGFVGSTGLSNGPHLHYEVLVNSRFVDPLQIQVPRERRLSGKQLADFQKERARIDELMRRAPVMTASR